jgi:hypothetical protein
MWSLVGNVKHQTWPILKLTFPILNIDVENLVCIGSKMNGFHIKIHARACFEVLQEIKFIQFHVWKSDSHTDLHVLWWRIVLGSHVRYFEPCSFHQIPLLIELWYTKCSVSLCHNSRRWFLRSFWVKNFISTWGSLELVLELRYFSCRYFCSTFAEWTATSLREYTWWQICYQHDGILSFSMNIILYLTEQFLGWCISHSGMLYWPLHPPDLNMIYETNTDVNV